MNILPNADSTLPSESRFTSGGATLTRLFLEPCFPVTHVTNYLKAAQYLRQFILWPKNVSNEAHNSQFESLSLSVHTDRNELCKCVTKPDRDKDGRSHG